MWFTVVRRFPDLCPGSGPGFGQIGYRIGLLGMFGRGGGKVL